MGAVEQGLPVSGVIAVEEERLARLEQDRHCLYRALAPLAGGLYLTDVGTRLAPAACLARASEAPAAEGRSETDRASSRRLRSVRDHAQEGRGTGGARRFGWLGPDGASGRRTNTVLEPYESAYLRQAIDRALEGQSWSGIADWLTAEGVPTAHRSRWTVPTVQSMVTNPAICGYRVVDGEIVRDRVSGEPVVGSWQRIATPEEWAQLVARCGRWHAPGEGRRGVPAGRRPEPGTEVPARRKYLLAGLLSCGHRAPDGEMCGSKLGGQPAWGTNRFPSYRCVAAQCRKVGRRSDMVDRHVQEVALSALEDRYGSTSAELDRFPGEARLAELTADPKATPMTVMQIRDLEEERRLFHEARRQRNLLAGFRREHWDAFDMEEKRHALAAVIDSVVVLPIPKNRTRNAPFDPALIEVVLRDGE
jgi:hypothetical protein